MSSFVAGAPSLGHSQPLIDTFLAELEARCTKRGMLSFKDQHARIGKGFVRRRLVSNRITSLFILENSSLWQCDQNAGGETELMKINLSHISTGSACAYIDTDDSSNKSFIIEIKEIQSLGAASIGHYEDDVLKASPLQLHLEASTQSEASDWVTKICSEAATMQQHYGDDEAIMLGAESAICKREYLRSVEMFESVAYLETFEGALENDVIRQAFRKYLGEHCEEKLLSFWENAEDFRRACANKDSDDAFPFVGVEGQIVGATRKEWAQSIFMNYLAEGALMEISDCSAEKRDALKASLFEDDAIPPSEIFASFGASVYRRLKDKFYPSFASAPGYSDLLQRGLRYSRRMSEGLKPLSTLISRDDRITNLDHGIIDISEGAKSEHGLANSFLSLIVGSSSKEAVKEQKRDPHDSHPHDSEDDVLVRNTWWRGKDAMRDQGTMTALPDWWWRFTDLQVSDKEQTEADIISAQLARIAPIRKQWMKELETIYGPSGLRELLAGGCAYSVVVPTLFPSPNYPISQLDIYGVIKFAGVLSMYSPGSKAPPMLVSCSVVEFLGKGRLMLYQPDGSPIGTIRLELISCVQASSTKVNTVTLFEGEGPLCRAAYEFSSSRPSESAGYYLTQSFFREIILFCPRNSVSMVHAGYVQKRQGGSTTALYRNRWCVLLSTGVFVYYKPADLRSMTAYRGEIELETALVRIYAASGPLSFSVEVPAKSFEFRTSKKEERDDWTRILGTMIIALKPFKPQD